MVKRKLADLVPQKEPRKHGADPRELGRTISVGVGLKEGEVAEIDDIAASIGLSRNAIMGWALRHFLKAYQAGDIDLPIETETKRTLGEP